VRKRPDVKPAEARSTRPVHKDTIEISRDKLKEEALNRVRHTSKLVIAQNGFMRVGKYMFLAIAFPPYFLIYTLPKWVIAVALPTLASVCSVIFKTIQKKTQKQLEQGIRKTEQLVQYFRRISLVLIAPIARLLFEVKQGIRRGVDKARLVILRFGNAVKRTVSLPFQQVLRTASFIRNKTVIIKEKVNEKWNLLTERLHEGIQQLKHIPPVVISWGFGQFQQLKERIIGKEAFFPRQWKTSQSMADKAVNWTFQKFNRQVERVKSFIDPAKTFFRENIFEPCKKVLQAIQSQFKQGSDFFHRKQKNGLAFLEKKQRRLREITSDQMEEWIGRLGLPKGLKAFLQKICGAIFRIAVQAYSSVLSLCTTLLKFLSNITQLLSKGKKTIVLFFQSGIAYTTSALKVLGGLFSKATRISLYYSILYSLVVVIVMIRGMRLLASTGEAFTKKLSQLIRSAR
jgi:hypothetical protein